MAADAEHSVSRPHDPAVAGPAGSLIWLVGGPSVGKSSSARAIQRLGGVRDGWLLAGDHHLLRQVLADQLVRYAGPFDDAWEWWSIPSVDERLIGRPRAGRRALRLLDGMYRSAVALVRAGNNVVLEDVVWEPAVATIALEALGAIDPLVVRLVCPYAVAVDRERARPDRFVGGVAAYAGEPELITDVDLTLDSAQRDRESIARQILAAVAAHASKGRVSDAGVRDEGAAGSRQHDSS